MWQRPGDETKTNDSHRPATPLRFFFLCDQGAFLQPAVSPETYARADLWPENHSTENSISQPFPVCVCEDF